MNSVCKIIGTLIVCCAPMLQGMDYVDHALHNVDNVVQNSVVLSTANELAQKTFAIVASYPLESCLALLAIGITFKTYQLAKKLIVAGCTGVFAAGLTYAGYCAIKNRLSAL